MSVFSGMPQSESTGVHVAEHSSMVGHWVVDHMDEMARRIKMPNLA